MVHIGSLCCTLILPYLTYCVLAWRHSYGTHWESMLYIDLALSNILCVGMGTHLWYTPTASISEA